MCYLPDLSPEVIKKWPKFLILSSPIFIKERGVNICLWLIQREECSKNNAQCLSSTFPSGILKPFRGDTKHVFSKKEAQDTIELIHLPRDDYYFLLRDRIRCIAIQEAKSCFSTHSPSCGTFMVHGEGGAVQITRALLCHAHCSCIWLCRLIFSHKLGSWRINAELLNAV